MNKLFALQPSNVFAYFEEICKIPHGSSNLNAICDYCVEFAKENNFRYIRDELNNIVIFKNGTNGSKTPVILQAHLDMVCQKTNEAQIDFEKDGLDIFIDGGYIRAKGTTLGADNGIGVAMIMAILADDKLLHPPIEAVLTADEEIGMIGAAALDTSILESKRMINLDSEESDLITVSCAGGNDVRIYVPITREKKNGTRITVKINGLKGGHSGIDIDKNRENANILMGRILNHIQESEFNIISIDGGTKRNAIPFGADAQILVGNAKEACALIKEYAKLIEEELCDAEENLQITINEQGVGEYEVLDKKSGEKIIYMLLNTPNGIVKMSERIKGLVETSLNLGIVSTQKENILLQYALRSNKKTALDFLEERMKSFSLYNESTIEISGRYEPWEYKEESPLRDEYALVYERKTGKKPKVDAIHAGLECAIFSSTIKNLDCIAIGPDTFDAHTTNERLNIESTKIVYELLCDTLEGM